MIKDILDFMMIRYEDMIFEKYMQDDISYIGKNENETIAIVINSKRKKSKITEKHIKSLSSNLNSFYNKNNNVKFYYFVKNEENLQDSAKFYLIDKMCLLNYVSLKENKIYKKIEQEKNEPKVTKKMSKSQIAKKQKGNDYEVYCGKIIEEKEFIVKYNGLENGVNDHSIDLIAISKNDILLIQCKNWSEAYCKRNGYLSRQNFMSFVGECDDFVRNNKVYQNFEIYKLWIVSDLKTVDKEGLAFAYNEKNFMLQEIKIKEKKDDGSNLKDSRI